MRKVSFFSCAAAAMLVMLTAGSAWTADVPMLLNYQGNLSAPSGIPKNGTFTMQFAVYDAATGGNQLPSGTPWSETQNVTVTNGLFNVLLGSVTALPTDLFQGGPSDSAGPLRFLQVTVNGEALSPRNRIASSAYSIAQPTSPPSAWVAEDLFESESIGDLNGQAGGTGWATSWQNIGTTSTYQVESNVVYQGTKAVNGDRSGIKRQLATDISGSNDVLYFAMRRDDSGSTGRAGFVLHDASSAVRVRIDMNNAGNIAANGVTILTNYTRGVWYVFRLTLNSSSDWYSVAISRDAYGTAGAFSPWPSLISMSGSGVIRYASFDCDVGGLSNPNYLDYVSPTSPYTH